jgi:Zn-dependent membrane protease YugP
MKKRIASGILAAIATAAVAYDATGRAHDYPFLNLRSAIIGPSRIAQRFSRSLVQRRLLVSSRFTIRTATHEG